MSDDIDHHEREHESRRAQQPEAPGHDGPEHSPVQRLASAIGNQNFSQLISRLDNGAGILPDGTAHPDVHATIASMSGRGRTLDGGVSEQLATTYGDLSDVSIHTGPAADALARSVSARAFTVGTDVFFANGEYDPHTSDGAGLLRHELAHVVQQRDAPAVGPLVVSQPGDPLERDADDIARNAAV